MRALMTMAILTTTAALCVSRADDLTRQPSKANTPLTIYVFPGGNDSSSGLQPEARANSNDGPKRTFKGAADEIKALKDAKALKGPVKVLFGEGRYFISEPLRLGVENSWPTSFESLPGETAIFDGGARIGSWSQATLNGAKVWVADVSSIIKERGAFRQLFVNGRRAEMARVPAKGSYRLEISDKENKPIELKDKPIELVGNVSFGFKDSEKDGIEVAIGNKWTMYRVPLSSLKPQADKALEAPRLSTGATPKDPVYYWAENVLSALREPGTWAMDSKKGRIYYLPLPGEELESSECFAACAMQLLAITGNVAANAYVEDIAFRNIAFEHAGRVASATQFFAQGASNVPGAVIIEGARGVVFEGCRFERLGGYAVQFKAGCSKNKISRCSFLDLGAGGVIANGAGATQNPNGRTGDNIIADCEFKDGGRIFLDACAILIMNSGGNQIVHNLIKDYGYTGISVGWVWGYADSVSRDNLIIKNHIFNIGMGKILSDMAGIYTLGISPGTKIRGNLIHDVDKGAYAGNGIYLDEGSSCITVQGNVCYNVASRPFFQHYGKDNIVVNNIFAFGKECVAALLSGRTRTQGYPFSRFDNNCSVFFYRNILLSNGTAIYDGGDSAASKLKAKNIFSDLNTIWDVSGKEPFNGKPESPMPWSAWKALGEDVNSQIANPNFKNPLGGDFTLPKNSPAFKLGFAPIDVSDAGPRAPGFDDLLDDSSTLAVTNRDHPLLNELIKVKKLGNAPDSANARQGVEWPLAVEAIKLYQNPEREIVQHPAFAKLAYDLNCLYASVQIPFNGKIVADKGWGTADGVEICMRDASATPPGPVFILHGFPSGRIEGSCEGGSSKAAASKLEGSASFAASVSGDCWTANWSIPFKALGVKPASGVKLGFNIGVYRSSYDEWINLMGTLGPTWELDGARCLVLE